MHHTSRVTHHVHCDCLANPKYYVTLHWTLDTPAHGLRPGLAKSFITSFTTCINVVRPAARGDPDPDDCVRKKGPLLAYDGSKLGALSNTRVYTHKNHGELVKLQLRFPSAPISLFRAFLSPLIDIGTMRFRGTNSQPWHRSSTLDTGRTFSYLRLGVGWRPGVGWWWCRHFLIVRTILR